MADSQKKIYIIIILLVILVIFSLLVNYENFESIPIQNGSDSVLIENEQNNIQQNNIQTPNSNSLCKVAFDNYDLYPSTNPFVVKGNDINWNYQNNITDYDTLYKLGTSNYTALNNIIPDYNPNDIESTKTAFNILLQQSPKKIGCCFRQQGDNSKRTVLARTPLNPDDKSVTPPFDQYDFKFKSIDIPGGTCPVSYYGGSTDCNAFFDVYCKNILNEFKKNNFNPNDFTKYAPECACYAPKTETQQIYPDNTPPACYKTGCDNIINPTAYIDPISRSTPCDITVCQNIFNAQVGNVSGNVTIDPKLENTCGKYSDSSGSSDSSASTTPSSNASTSGTSGSSGSTTTPSNASTSGSTGSTTPSSNASTSGTSGTTGTTGSSGSSGSNMGVVLIVILIVGLVGSSGLALFNK